jgi:hypothetical protein
MARVRALGCLICRLMGFLGTPASAHHCFDTSDKDDFLTIPLCPEHHQGATGFHGLGERAFNRTYKTSERRLLGMTYRLLNGGTV